MNHGNHGGQSMKRQRGRGRKPGGGQYHGNNYGGGGGNGGGHNNPNRTLESNGPETKVRGPASVILERYQQLARDAASSGDRVLSENYLQHADHYFRLWRSTQPAQPVQPVRYENETDGDDEGGPESDTVEIGEAHAEAGEQREGDFAQERPQGQQQNFDRGEGGGESRNRGRRRNRFRPEGERQEGEGGGERVEARRERPEGEPRRERAEGDAPREAREPRRERAPRDRDGGESEGPEGFSNGPKPAFLRGD